MAVWKRNDGNGAVAPHPARPTAAEQQTHFLANNSMLRTSLGADAEVTGRLSFNAPTRIDGKLKGDVKCTDLLVIGESGTVDGNVNATELVVLGRIEGDIRGAQRVEIGPLGRVTGTIETGALAVREGGRLDAACRVVSPRADVHVLAERRDNGEKPEIDD